MPFYPYNSVLKRLDYHQKVTKRKHERISYNNDIKAFPDAT